MKTRKISNVVKMLITCALCACMFVTPMVASAAEAPISLKEADQIASKLAYVLYDKEQWVDPWVIIEGEMDMIEKRGLVAEDKNKFLEVDLSEYYKTVPKSVGKILADCKNLKGLQVKLGGWDAVSFVSNETLKNMNDVEFDLTSTDYANKRVIDFERYQLIGTNVIFHTKINKTNTEGKVYMVDDNGKETFLQNVKSDADGRVCFTINQTGNYVIKY